MLKKKKFTYQPVLGSGANNSTKFSRRNSFDKVDFPDDFSTFSQGSKRQKLDEENRIPVEKKKVAGNNILVNDDIQLDLMDDDDFDFSQAVDEIEQIEIAASQMPRVTKAPQKHAQASFKPVEIDEPDILDVLLSGESKNHTQNGFSQNGSSFQLKIPKKSKNDLPLFQEKGEVSHSVKHSSFPNPTMPTMKQNNTFTTKQHHTMTTKQHNEKHAEKRQFDINVKKENDSIELLNTYKRKMHEAEQRFLSKDGEIGILRETLRKQSEEERKYKEKIHELEHNLKTQQSDKEARLLTEVDKLKTQLTFKEKEVQDMSEKQKKTATPKASQSHKRSPKIGFYSDAFEKSEKNHAQQSSSKNLPPKSTTFHCKTFKNLFQRDIAEFSCPKDIVTQADDTVMIGKDITLNCCHTEPFTCDDDEGMLNFATTLLSSMELIEHNHFYIPEFLNQVNCYLTSLHDLLSTPLSQAASSGTTGGRSDFSTQGSDTTSKKDCSLCTLDYENGLKCLRILTNVPQGIKEYLINGLVKFMGKEVEVASSQKKTDVECGGKKYFLKYPALSEFLITKEISNTTDILHKTISSTIPFDTAVQFWTILGQLLLIDCYAEVENSLFLMHRSLLTYPLKCAEIHCSYLVDHEVVSRHLNIITEDRILTVLDLLQKLVPLKSITKLICNKSDRCPLLLIYNWLINEDLQKDSYALKIFLELVSLLSSVISQYQTHAYTAILESTCRCSNEIIEFLIVFLFDEFKYFQERVFLDGESGMNSRDVLRFFCYRQGMSLLCLLCCNEKNLADKRSAVECNYIYLLAGTVKMYRKIPWINDKEVLDLEDVLDMDQYLDFDLTPENMDTDQPQLKM